MYDTLAAMSDKLPVVEVIERPWSIGRMACSKFFLQNPGMELFLKETQILMRQVIDDRADNELAELIDFHFQAEGKLNRPRAVGLLSQALGVEPERTVGWSAALEMFHNGSLIHDDLQDGDICRRGVPTLWYAKGKNRAMNAGTFLMLNSFECLRRSKLDKHEILKLGDLLSRFASEALAGQCREEELNRLSGLRGLRERYVQVVEQKTAALFAKLAAGVAVAAKLDEEQARELESLFKELGELFQLQDDILDLYGDKQRDMQGNDLKEGKVSFLILKHLELYHYNLEAMRKLLSQGREQLERGEILVVKEQFARDGTLGAALEEFTSRCLDLAQSEYLEENPRVSSVIGALMEAMVKPLSHLSDAQSRYWQDLSKLLVRQESGF